jgi:hypothetical protein
MLIFDEDLQWEKVNQGQIIAGRSAVRGCLKHYIYGGIMQMVEMPVYHYENMLDRRLNFILTIVLQDILVLLFTDG